MDFRGKNIDDSYTFDAVTAVSKGVLDVSWSTMSVPTFRRLIAHMLLCPDLRVIAVGFPTIDALNVLQGMDMLDRMIDGRIVTSEPDRRDIEIRLARDISLGKKVDDLAGSLRSMRTDLDARDARNDDLRNIVLLLADINKQRLEDDKARDAKYAAEQIARDAKYAAEQAARDAKYAEEKAAREAEQADRDAKYAEEKAARDAKYAEVKAAMDASLAMDKPIVKLKGTVKQVANNLTNMHADMEHVMGKPFVKVLKESGYTCVTKFDLNELKDFRGRSVVEVDYIVSAVKNAVKYVYVMEVKSFFNQKYFHDMELKLDALQECIVTAFEDAPDQETEYLTDDYDIQSKKVRMFFGRKYVVQPVVAAPYVCDDSLAQAKAKKYWCWMRSDQGYAVFVNGKSVASDLPLPETEVTEV